MNTKQKIQRQKRVRKKIHGSSDRPRLSLFKSNRYIYAQIIDDVLMKTIVGISEKNLEKAEKLAKDKSVSGGKTDRAKEMGTLMAKIALDKKIKKVIFDRGENRYHGRVKAFAEGAREGGLEF